MGLETDITDIQSLNQNWPPVSDPRAQGADHIRNIKKAIQLTFPNLKQCLLNDAQFTSLGTLIGDGSGTFTINGKLTVSDTLTVKRNLTVEGEAMVPSVTDWTTQQAVGAKDAEGRYLKPGDADGRYLKPGDADSRYIQRAVGTLDYAPMQGGIQKSTGNIWLTYNDGTGIKYAFAQPAGDYATNTTVNGKIAKNTSQGPSVDSMGIVSASGQPFCTDSAGHLRYIVKSPGATPTDIPIQSVGINNQRIYVSYDNDTQAAWLVRSPAEGSTDTRVGSVGIAGGVPYFGYGGDNDAYNPMWLAKASDLPRTFISAQQGVQTNYKYVIPHNLGRVPDVFWVYLVNVSPDWGYNPGQIAIPSFDDKSNGGFGPLPVIADSWNIFLPMSDAVPLVSRMDPANGDNTLGDRHSINADGWRFVFYAVCMRG